ncbi:MAG TPA: diguanylate cyclase [Stenomitos sp.]
MAPEQDVSALQNTPAPEGSTGAPDYAAVANGFRAINEAKSPEDVPFALLMQSIGLVGAAHGAIVSRDGTIIAAIPFGAGANLPIKDAGIWEGELGQVHSLPVTSGRLHTALRFALQGNDDLAMVLASPSGAFIAPERLFAIQLLSTYAGSRSQYLMARQEADEAQTQAKAAHEQQMEMALRLYDLYEEAQNQAITDGLTGLATHAFFQQRLAQEMSESFRYHHPLSFIIFDLDHFKPINDTYGHQAGDIVLKEASAMLKAKVRTSDLVARYGGEEFAIILPQTTEEDAYNLAERLRQELEQMEIQINADRKLKVTASIGLASRGENDATPKELIKRADMALYAAKNGGRNRVVRAQGPAAEAVNAIGAPRKGSQEMFLALARALSAAIEARSPMLHGHSEAVGELALRMGKALGLHPDKQEALMIAGMLHDVGMLAVPEAVILKPSALNDEEWAQMKSHPQAGVAILSRFSTFAGLREAVLYHHERWDGRGYPEGLKGEGIPMGARILAVCDAYDAMIRGDYAYGMGVPEKEAAAEIQRCAGTQFDPQLVDLFLGVLSGMGQQGA